MNLLQLLEAKIFDVPKDWLGTRDLEARIKAACEKEGATYYRLPLDFQSRKVSSANKLGAQLASRWKGQSGYGFVYLTNDKRYICVIHPAKYPPAKVQKIRVSTNMKNVVMRTILKCMKEYAHDSVMSARPLDIIHLCRELGYDYPEFKVIEKSMENYE